MRIGRRVTCVAVALGLVTAPGCVTDLLRGWEDYPATSVAFCIGAVTGGAPAIVASAPVTLPLAAGQEDLDALVVLLAPGLPTGFLGGCALAAPTAILEFLLRLPLEAVQRIFGQRRVGVARPVPPVAEPRASLIVSQPPGVEALLDGEVVGRTPVSVVFPDRGTVTVRFRREGGASEKHELQREPGSRGPGAGWEETYEFVLSGSR